MPKIIYPRFRAWYKGKKDSYGDSNYDIPPYMIYDIQRIYDGLDPKLDPYGVCAGLGSFGQLLSYEDSDGNNPFIVMQYTTLKDSQGKDIWEGDLLKWSSNMPTTFRVVRFGKYIMSRDTRDESHIGFYASDPRDNYSEELDGEYATVIGNIYENPEICPH